MKTANNTSCKGFTLIEVLIAALVLGIGILATATMIARSTIQDSRAYYMTRASMMMEEFIENATHAQYESGPFANMTNSSINTNIDGIDYSMNCALRNDEPIVNTKEMTCVVSWNNKGIQARTTYVYVFSQKY